MGVYTRPGSPYWQLWLENAPKGQQRRGTKIRIGTTKDERTASREAALAVYAAAVLKLGRQAHGLEQPDAPPPLTFGAYADTYTRDVIAHHKGADREREIVAVLRKAFGTLPLTAVTRDAVRAWMTTRRETASARTVNREVDLLKAMLRDAVPAHLPASPLAGMPRLKTPPVVRRILSPDDEAKLLAACEDAQDTALLVLGIDTLARMGDLLDLRRSDRAGDWITLRDTKNGTAVEAPLSERAAAALDALGKTGDYYFPKFRAAKNPRDWRGSVRQRLEYLGKQAGVKIGKKAHGVTWHWATRTTGTTRLVVDKGVSPAVVARLGGWRTPDVPLRIYTEADKASLLKAVRPLTPHAQRPRAAKKR